jgi:hypothetical protein
MPHFATAVLGPSPSRRTVRGLTASQPATTYASVVAVFGGDAGIVTDFEIEAATRLTQSDTGDTNHEAVERFE